MNLADVIDDDDSILLADFARCSFDDDGSMDLAESLDFARCSFDDDGSFAAGDRFFAIASCVNVRCSKHALSKIQQQSLCFVTTDYTTAIAYCCVCWDVWLRHNYVALI